ncbi:MAG: NupC/NupG family nucleoside CNT transporter [Deltaproteobacteria bacterium]|nr:NupC/NupG family nucleoside CNT transporter [Deltaproteobacteria bacterium]
MSDLGLRATSALGLGVMIAVAWSFSNDRRRVPWRTIATGLAIQLALGLLLLRTTPGRLFFVAMNDAVSIFLGYTQAGVDFVFGALATTGFSFVVNVLPIVVFMGAIFSILHHLRVVQPIVELLGRALARSMGTSGAESLSAVANIFLGMVESPLLVKPYLARMTQSELFCVMTVGMASIAGSVLIVYVQMLGGGDWAGHLVTASFLSAPAGILISKVMVPERETPETLGTSHVDVPRIGSNLIDAAAIGAIDGMRLCAYIGAMLLAFVSVVAMLNDGLALIGRGAGIETLTMQKLLGWALSPLALAMGVSWQDAVPVGSLLGVKTVLNEFIAYDALGTLIRDGTIAPRSAVIASYALCGFANFGSLAILLGGLGGLAPSRRGDLARLGLRSIAGGSLASFMTGCVAGLLL